ncbi:MAG: putative toxin-antitoxin system toxin component, PIN family [Chloroflexi bacterium]|nr:putative toxin-antitoxin system toxin component, PIN family [Chloroflexota bacterium]
MLDTNLVMSGLLWSGAPHDIIGLIDARPDITLCTSPALIAEFRDVISRPKFQARLTAIQHTVDDLIGRYLKLSSVFTSPDPIPAFVLADPDDDEVIACAIAAEADYIVSGDRHLLDLKSLDRPRIVTAAEFLAVLQADGYTD